jgi:DNA phosphorothioation-associated DGQHR protein 1
MDNFMKSQSFYNAPVLVVRQPLGDFYLVALPASILLRTAYSHRLKAVLKADGSYELKGSQRMINDDRLKAIGEYISGPEAAFPNSLILAANFVEDTGELEHDEEKRWALRINPDGATGELTIPTAEKLAAIIDGQHRLFGFQFANKERLNMFLSCAIYFDLPKPFQAYLFATINSKQKPVDKSQTYELFGYNIENEPSNYWTPDKLAVFLTRKLNTDKDSPFCSHIIIAAENDIVQTASQAKKNDDWMISLATIVEGILRLISRNSRRDAIRMLGDNIKERNERSIVEIDKNEPSIPLRDYFRSTNDTVIYTVVRNFFAAVELVFWKKEVPGFIRKTIGVQALFDILRELIPAALLEKDISSRYFVERLKPAESLDFSADFFQASGTGKTRIRNCIEIAIGVKSIADLGDHRDLDSYLGVLGTFKS